MMYDARKIEEVLRAAVPNDVSDADVSAIDWEQFSRAVAEELAAGLVPYTGPAECRALGHQTAYVILFEAGLLA